MYHIDPTQCCHDLEHIQVDYISQVYAMPSIGPLIVGGHTGAIQTIKGSIFLTILCW